MQDYVFWSGVMGGIPMAAALIQLALDRWSDTVRARSIARRPAAVQRPASDSGQYWMDE
jgi:hypothetical protein